MSYTIDETAATRQHLEMLIRKRNTLNEAINNSFEQLFTAVERGDWNEEDCVQWYNWVKSLKVPSTIKRMLKALGVSQYDVKLWQEFPSGIRYQTSGTFPLNNQRLPKKGTPVVYLLKTRSLLKDLVFVSYVGRTENVKARFQAHWKSDKREWMHYWEVIPCNSVLEMKQLEADLIYQHKPTLNVSGTQTRGYFAEQVSSLFNSQVW